MGSTNLVFFYWMIGVDFFFVLTLLTDCIPLIKKSTAEIKHIIYEVKKLRKLNTLIKHMCRRVKWGNQIQHTHVHRLFKSKIKVFKI